MKIGDESSLSGKNSIPMLTAAMLKSGTATRSKKEINDQLDKLKSSISFSSSGGGSAISVNVVTDKDNCMATLDLLADMLMHPAFDSNEFSKLMIDIGADLDQNRSDPQYVAVTTFQQKMTPYPKGHPLYPETLEEQAADLKTVKLADVRDFMATFMEWITGLCHSSGVSMRRRSRVCWKRVSDHSRAGSPIRRSGRNILM